MPATDTAARNMRERLMPLEEITDLVTARLDGPLQDHADIHTDEETAAAAWLVAEAVRYLNAATQGPAAPGMTEPSTAYAVAGALAVASARLARLAGQLAEWLASEVASGAAGGRSNRRLRASGFSGACSVPPGVRDERGHGRSGAASQPGPTMNLADHASPAWWNDHGGPSTLMRPIRGRCC